MQIVNKYKIEQKISTLAYCIIEKKNEPTLFEIDEIKFSRWGLNSNTWLAIATIEAEDYRKAFNEFSKKLSRLIPRISLISQSYIEYFSEPFLIYKIRSDMAFFRYTKEVDPVGLMFNENEQKALKILLENKEIPEAFYYYWNDAVNTIGYSAKLLLMFFAINVLTKQETKQLENELKDRILGIELRKKLFEQRKGLRHRLVHGEHLSTQDTEDYVKRIHDKVINYFNTNIFSETLIHENIVCPQRHFFGNKQEDTFFVKRKDKNSPFSLKTLLQDYTIHNGFSPSAKYEEVSDNFTTY